MLLSKSNLNTDEWQKAFSIFQRSPKWFNTILDKTIKRLSRKIGHVLFQFKKEKFGDDKILY